MLLEVRRLPGNGRKLVEPVDGLRRLALLLSGEADHATDGRREPTTMARPPFPRSGTCGSPTGCDHRVLRPLEREDRPLVLLRAPSVIFGEPPGLYPTMSRPPPRQYVRIDHDEVVEGTSHYSIVRGARGAAAVAAHGC